MKYVVVWPRARFLVDGKRVVVSKGYDVPSGVDETVLHELALVGAIVAASPPQVSPEAAALVDPVDPGEVERPAKNAKVAEWRAYAEVVGVNSELTKEEIIAAVTALDEVPASPPPAPAEVVPGSAAGDGDSAGNGDPDAPTIS